MNIVERFQIIGKLITNSQEKYVFLVDGEKTSFMQNKRL